MYGAYFLILCLWSVQFYWLSHVDLWKLKVFWTGTGKDAVS